MSNVIASGPNALQHLIRNPVECLAAGALAVGVLAGCNGDVAPDSSNNNAVTAGAVPDQTEAQFLDAITDDPVDLNRPDSPVAPVRLSLQPGTRLHDSPIEGDETKDRWNLSSVVPANSRSFTVDFPLRRVDPVTNKVDFGMIFSTPAQCNPQASADRRCSMKLTPPHPVDAADVTKWVPETDVAVTPLSPESRHSQNPSAWVATQGILRYNRGTETSWYSDAGRYYVEAPDAAQHPATDNLFFNIGYAAMDDGSPRQK